MPDAAAAPAAVSADASPGAAGGPGNTGSTAKPAAPVVATEVAKQEAKDAAPKYKVKIDGVEKEVTLDELQKGYQLESSSRKRQQEATEAKKAADGILAAAKAGDYQALKAAGLTEGEIEQLSIKYLSAQHQSILEEERRRALDPAARDTEDKLRELDSLKAEKKKTEDAQRTQRVAIAKQQLSKAVIDTMQEFPESVRRNEALAQNVFEAWAYCVQHPDEAKELGIDVSPKGIAAAVRKRQRELAQAMVASAEDEELAELVPESIAARILAKKKAAAEKAAHPQLTGTPQVRGASGDQKPTIGRRNSKLRELTLGSLGIKG